MKNEKNGVVGFAFGAPHAIYPNQVIADCVEATMSARNAIGVTQKDVLCQNCLLEVEYIPSPQLSTLAVARFAIEWANKNGVTTLFVVAAKPHRRRCMRDLRIASREAGYGIKLVDVEVSSTSWFCPASTQPRTRTWLQWWMRESVLYAICVISPWAYKKIAK